MTDFVSAVAAVETWLATLGCRVDRIEARERDALYPERGFLAGWRIAIDFPGGHRRLDLLLPIGFPWQPPRVALVDAPPFLTWPHVEKDNVLCLAPNTFEVNPDAPAEAALYVLGKAEEALNDLIAGKCDDDFRDEFLSYWDWASNSGKRVISLLRPEPPTRAIFIWKGEHFYLLGETVDDLRNWLSNGFGKPPKDFDPAPAALVWAGTPPVPRDYPATGSSVRALFEEQGDEAKELLAALARDYPEKIFVALGVETANGAALGGIVMPAPKGGKYGARDVVNKGFRPGLVPPGILMSRYFGGQAVMRRSIERADAAWVHGRGKDERASSLRGKTVVVLGCGSLGAPIAISLAQSGVGRLILVDFDGLSWANISRHPLGATHVKRAKAKALAEKLRADFPHSAFEYHEIDVDTAVRKHSDLLQQADLIVAATGSWAAESRLDAWHASIQRQTPILYTWTEPHAAAGHALLLAGEGPSLRDGFDGTGLPDFRVTEWPGDTQTLQEPSCGAVYQPYGPVELGFVCNLAGELAMEALLGEVHRPAYRLWIGAGKRLRELGGSWTPAWRADPQFREDGGQIAERAWRVRPQAQAA